jgi:hypothetical protein
MIFQVYPLPAKQDSIYSMKFFVAGASHVEQSDFRLLDLKVGEQLFLMDDIQNEYPNALTIRTAEPKYLLGYCPSFASTFIKAAVLESPHSVLISEAKANIDAPTQYSLLCDAKIPVSHATSSIIENLNF